jgi:eukaryotic-like serine/threonine-protein kinase
MTPAHTQPTPERAVIGASREAHHVARHDAAPGRFKARIPTTVALTPGTRIGSYEIADQIGVGGMGEVYRASDTKLRRDVAIKVLPAAVASDAGRLARFEREAQLLASLNHPNIAAIYGLEETEGSTALVMELVEGRTLAERIASGSIGLDKALAIAVQIAEAVTAAHERGVVHRDLKPSNIKVRPDGAVKVLDFGIAKAMASALMSASLQAPTLTVTRQSAGPGPGTPAYMSPEQARGEAVDHRTDIWAFGCILYEMLAGRAAFGGGSVTDVLARVLQSEPDWKRLPARVPPSIEHLLRLCLEKNLKKRRQSAGDVRIDLEHALTEPRAAAPTQPVGQSRPTRVAWIASVAVLAAALAIPTVIHLREAPPPEMWLQITTPPTLAPLDFALSPDGRHIVYVAAESSRDNLARLYLRALGEIEARPLPNTEGARHPFWSPDGLSIGFFASERLLRIDITGGPAQTLVRTANPLGGSWGADGIILFAPDSVSPLFRVAESGGTAVAATELDSPRHQNHRRPTFLPDGRRFLFYVAGDPEVSGLYLGSLDGGAAKRLAAADDSPAAYLAPDLVVFAQQGALVARRLDNRGELTGDLLTLARSTSAAGSGLVGLSASASGILAFRAETSSATTARMTWFDRAGNVLELGAALNGPELSPDERYVAYDRTIAGNRDVWILDLVRGGSTRFTTHAAVDGYPVWSPDGRQLVFESQRNGTFDLWIKQSSGAGEEELLLGTADNEIPIGWSRDGRFFLYRSSNDDYTSSDLWALPMTGDDRTPVVVANTPFEERMGEFSPDGRWVAYDTNESGRFEVRVRAFPEPEGAWPVSTDGGVAPRWTTDGEIHFIALDGTMMAARVTTGSSFEAERPEPLFPTRISGQPFNHQYAVSRDGRFLVHNAQAEDLATPITVVLNWRP